MIHTQQVINKATGYLSNIVVSYHDENGKKQLMNFAVPEDELFEWGEISSGTPSNIKNLRSAHGKRLKKIPLSKYRTLSKFRVYELFNSLPDDVKEIIYAPNQPVKTFFDIETESTGSFPNANNPKHKVLSNVFVTDDLVEMCGLKDMSPDDITTIERNIAAYFSSLKNKALVEKPYRVKYYKFETEREMLAWIYSKMRDFDMLLGWNCLKFDMLYLANRSVTVDGVDLDFVDRKSVKFGFYKQSSQTKDVFDLRLVDKFSPDVKINVPVPYHTPVLDYMEIVEKFDRKKRSKYNLDSIADEVLEGIKKVSYGGTLQDLYDTDFITFMFYNAVDSILVQLIDKATDIFSIVPTLASVSQVPIHDALFAGMMCERKFQNYYYSKDMVFVQKNEPENTASYEGGLVKDPVVGMAKYIMIYDFTSKFPSGMMAFNLGVDTLLGHTIDKVQYVDDKTGEKVKIDKSVHVINPNGYVYDKSKGDSSLRTIIFDLFNGRVERKEKAKEVEREMQAIERYRDGVGELEDFVHSTFRVGDTPSSNELYSELERLIKLAKRYDNESQAMKIIMNSIYGVLGYKFFPLYNVPVASSVTAQSRDLLQYTIDIVNDYFNKEWLEDKATHEALGISVSSNVLAKNVFYADTDSIFINIEYVINTTNLDGKDDPEKMVAFCLLLDKVFFKPFFKRKFIEYCESWGAFATRPDGVDSFKLGLEEIDFKILFVKKKRYIKNPLWSDGKTYKPNEKLSYKGVEIAKPSYSEFIRKKLSQIMENIMSQDGGLDMMKVAREVKLVKEEFNNAGIDDIVEMVRVNNFTNSVISENPLMFVTGAPQNHRASAIHNNLIKTDPSLKKFPLISNGQKVGVYFTGGVEKTDDVFAFPVFSGVPDKAPKVDKKLQFEKMILAPINNIIKVIDATYKLSYDLYVVDTSLW